MQPPGKRLSSWVVCASLAASWPAGVSATEQSSEGVALRVLCYNIHHGRGTDDRVDLERIAAVIKSLKPDLVALQEVDRNTRRTGKVDQTEVLGRLTGLNARFGKSRPYDGGEYGQAILSRFPISEPTVHALPSKPQQETRIAVEVRVETPAGELRFIGTHFQHDDGPTRELQAKKVNDLFTNDATPTILVGDLNAPPDSEPLRLLAPVWKFAGDQSIPTFPSKDPRARIDHILYRPAEAFRVREASVVEEELASDHRPVFAVLEWVRE